MLRVKGIWLHGFMCMCLSLKDTRAWEPMACWLSRPVKHSVTKLYIVTPNYWSIPWLGGAELSHPGSLNPALCSYPGSASGWPASQPAASSSPQWPPAAHSLPVTAFCGNAFCSTSCHASQAVSQFRAAKQRSGRNGFPVRQSHSAACRGLAADLYVS